MLLVHDGSDKEVLVMIIYQGLLSWSTLQSPELCSDHIRADNLARDGHSSVLQLLQCQDTAVCYNVNCLLELNFSS